MVAYHQNRDKTAPAIKRGKIALIRYQMSIRRSNIVLFFQVLQNDIKSTRVLETSLMLFCKIIVY